MHIPHILFLLPLALASDQRPFQPGPLGKEYRLVSRQLVREIDQVRQDCGIHGAAIAVVRRREKGVWEEDVFGVGVADGRGNKVTENVSSFKL
jgi:hypothetical protein